MPNLRKGRSGESSALDPDSVQLDLAGSPLEDCVDADADADADAFGTAPRPGMAAAGMTTRVPPEAVLGPKLRPCTLRWISSSLLESCRRVDKRERGADQEGERGWRERGAGRMSDGMLPTSCAPRQCMCDGVPARFCRA
jgi:hypothetical protein